MSIGCRKTMTDAPELAADVAELATVEKTHVHNEGQLVVVFGVNSPPDAFQANMLSEGYAVAQIDATVEEGVAVTYRRITEF